MTIHVPSFEKNRWWSNADLSDPDVMIASILDDPTTLDLVEALLAWGVERVDSVRRRTREERSGAENRILDAIYDPIREGVVNALGLPA